MSFSDFLAHDQQLMHSLHAAPDRHAALSRALADGEEALGTAQSLAEQIEITMRLAATAALAAEDSREMAETAVVWAARCGRLVRGAAAEAHYLPRLASLVGAVAPALDDEARRVVIAGLQTWMERTANAVAAVTEAERDGDAWARVALAAEGVEGAEQLASEARARAEAAYGTAGGLRSQ